MGLAAVQWSETEDVTLTFTRDEWEDEATVTVRLYANDNDEIEAVSWHSIGSGSLTEDEKRRAREAARRKATES